MISPSGGGFGDPFRRVPAAVLLDVVNGLLTEAEAADIYGVIIQDGVLDADATARRRTAEATREQSVPALIHGPARQQYEVVWRTEVSAAFANAVLAVPPGLRRPVQLQARELLLSNGGQIDPAAAQNAVAEMAERMQKGRSQDFRG